MNITGKYIGNGEPYEIVLDDLAREIKIYSDGITAVKLNTMPDDTFLFNSNLKNGVEILEDRIRINDDDLITDGKTYFFKVW